jgi:glycosyltransferase involved in cell wall biosynthesis
MKIVMSGRILDRNVGGNTTYAREIATRLSEHGATVERLAAGRNPIATMIAETRDARRVRSQSVVHFVADTGPLLAPRIPSVVTVHGVASRWISTARSLSQELVWRARVGAAIKICDRVITVSESSADDISSVFSLDRNRISVIPHGLDGSKFDGEPRLSPEVRSKLPNEFILYVGNIEPRKNLIELVQAVEDNLSLPLLVIAGKPAWNYAKSMDAIRNAKRTIYLGFVSDSDRAALMTFCTAFVFPSLYEGFGFPVLEAMAAGAPVITTDRGSLKEVAGPSWILPSVDRESISHGIESALNDRAWMSQVGGSGRDWAKRFSWDESVSQHVEIYRELLQ